MFDVAFIAIAAGFFAAAAAYVHVCEKLRGVSHD